MTPGRAATLTGTLLSAGPVTRALWARVTGTGSGEGRIDEVSWFDAAAFCIALSKQSGLPPAYRFTEPHLRKSYSIDDVGRMLKGLGPPPKMMAIVNHFKTEALSIIQFTPDRLAEVPGITGKEAAEYAQKWDPDKCFIRDVVWDRECHGYRLPTEAEWLLLTETGPGAPPADGELDWVWCADPGPAYLTVPTPLPEGPVTDPATDAGPRRMGRGGSVRRAILPGVKEKGLGLRVVRTK